MKDLTRLLRTIPDAVDERPFIRRLVKAAGSAPVETCAPSSVFDLASRPVPKRRRPQPLTLRDLDLLQTAAPLEMPPGAVVHGAGFSAAKVGVDITTGRPWGQGA